MILMAESHPKGRLFEANLDRRVSKSTLEVQGQGSGSLCSKPAQAVLLLTRLAHYRYLSMGAR